MNDHEIHEYARRVRNNTGAMLDEVTKRPDGTAKGLTDAMAAAVMVAQSNLAIAASLVEAAAIIREGLDR
jgi:hypothetical protein